MYSKTGAARSFQRQSSVPETAPVLCRAQNHTAPRGRAGATHSPTAAAAPAAGPARGQQGPCAGSAWRRSAQGLIRDGQDGDRAGTYVAGAGPTGAAWQGTPASASPCAQGAAAASSQGDACVLGRDSPGGALGPPGADRSPGTHATAVGAPVPPAPLCQTG